MHFHIEEGIRAAVIIYLMAINLVAFAAMGIDKWKAKHHKWRIPEKTLFLFVILGGSIGGITGMELFRHKTQHKTFTIGFPLLLVIQIVSCVCIFYFKNN